MILHKVLARALVPVGICVSSPVLAEGDPPAPVPRTQTLEDYTQLVGNLLPQFGPAMLAAAPGPNWMAAMSVHDAAQAAGDSDPSNTTAQGPIVIGYDEPHGPRYVKLDFQRSYVRYANRDRSFVENVPCGAVPATAAQSVFLNAIAALGVPVQERGPLLVDTVVDRSVAGQGGPEVPCEVERMVTQTRQHPNGFPVFDSLARTAVSNLGACARILVEWPQFELAPGLIMRPRQDVVGELAQRIWEAEANSLGFGPEIELHVRLGYVKRPEGFVPAARASFTVVGTTDAGLILTVPIALNPASDLPELDSTPPRSVQFLARMDRGSGSAALDFYLPRASHVRLRILDVAGREVLLLVDDARAEGWHRVAWDLRIQETRAVRSGVYFCSLETASTRITRKLVVVR